MARQVQRSPARVYLHELLAITSLCHNEKNFERQADFVAHHAPQRHCSLYLAKLSHDTRLWIFRKCIRMGDKLPSGVTLSPQPEAMLGHSDILDVASARAGMEAS